MAEKKTEAHFTVLPHFLIRANTHPMEWVQNLACPGTSSLLKQAFEIERQLEKVKKGVSESLFKLVPSLPKEMRSKALELKRSINQGFKPMDIDPEFLRYAAGDLVSLFEEWNGCAHKREGLMEQARLTFREESQAAHLRFHQTLSEPLVEEGIFLTSQAFYEGVSQYIKRAPQNFSDRTKTQRQLERSLMQHLSRSCAKTTPRGVLAGIGIGDFNADGNMPKPASTGSHQVISRRRTLLSLAVVRQIAKEVSHSGELWREVVPRPNATCYFENGKIYFWTKQLSTEESLLALPQTDILETFFNLASSRSLSCQQLLSEVHEKFKQKFSLEELTVFYKKLCDKEFLVGFLEVPYEHRDGLGFLVAWLEKLGPSVRPEPLLGQLREIQGILHDLDEEQDFSKKKEIYQTLQSKVSGVFHDRRVISVSDLVVVDSFSGFGGLQFPEEVQKHLTTVMKVLQHLSVEAGVAFHSSRVAAGFLKSIGISDDIHNQGMIPYWKLFGDNQIQERKPAPSPQSEPKPPGKGKIFKNIFMDWLDGKDQIDAPAHSLDLMQDGLLASLPDLDSDASFGASELEFQVATEDLKSFEAGDYQIVVTALANNMASWLSRYSLYFTESPLPHLLKDYMGWLKKKLHPGKVWADTLLLSQGKTDTALIHTQMQDYAIELFGVKSGRPHDQIIPLRDLYMKVKDDSAELIWKRNGEEIPVHPFYSSIASPITLPPSMAFVRALGWAFSPSLFFWVGLLQDRKHLPRLTIGRTVILRETWIFNVEDLRKNFSSDDWETFHFWSSWRHRQGLPRHIFIQGESPFWVDLENMYSLAALNVSLKEEKGKTITCVEMLPSPEGTWAQGPRGKHAVQFLTGFKWEST